MTAYLVVTEIVKDLEKYKKYQMAAAPLIQREGGHLIAISSNGGLDVLEGKFDSQILVIIEFPDMDAIKRFYNSKEYQEVKKIREGTTTFNLWAVPASSWLK